MTETVTKKLSEQESIKADSRYLRGRVLEELSDASVDFVSDASYELLKFHGSYQGYDRDTATERKKAGLDKQWEFMLRMKCPAGKLIPSQYLAIDGICDRYANGTMRVTTRQTFQFHCIVKGALKPHIAALNALAISTLGGCGDVVRNVVCPAAPKNDAKYRQMREDCARLASLCAPKTRAYHEIWLGDDNLADSPPEESETVEPLYGKTYLPRKFKIGFALPEDNSVEVTTQDLGFVLVYGDDGAFQGYNVYVGGGLGITHNKPETYARLASPIAFVKPDELEKAAEAVVKIHRDYGDRTNRKHARLKYVVEEQGVAWTAQRFGEFFGAPFEAPRETAPLSIPDWMGRHPQDDAHCFIGVPIDSGRIKDDEHTRIRSALRDVILSYGCEVVLTADQNLILAGIKNADADAVEQKLRGYGVKLREDITEAHRYMLACVALPTCGKALSEAERVKLPLLDTFEKLLVKYGVDKEKITIRITGCPNGCARPYVGDIGIVGRTPDSYAVFIGGDFDCTRLSEKAFDRVPYEHLGAVFDVMFARYAGEKNPHETFGDFAHRLGVKTLAKEVEERLSGEYKWAKAA
ncbi:MAG: NADPH-dependent assimilatory sulfite reductase hemoprotein subunit [Rickettsiales bacterium]